MGNTATACPLHRRQPLRGAARRRRSRGQPSGTGGSSWAWRRGQSVGASQGRHAARDRGAARRRSGDLFPRHRQLRVVELAALGPVCGNAAAHHQPRPARRRRGRTVDRRPGERCPRDGRGAGPPAGARRLRLASHPATDDPSDRGHEAGRRQAQRRESAGLLRAGRDAACAQLDHRQEPAEAPAQPAARRRPARL